VFNASKKYNAQLKEIGNDYTGFCGTDWRWNPISPAPR